MKRWVRMVALATLVSFSAGCAAAQAWWQDIKTNPVGTLQQDFGYISNAVDLATVAFNLFASLQPAVAEQVRPQFNAVVARIRQALALAMDTLRTAADAQGNPPNPDVLLRDARTALADLQSLLTALPGNGVGHASSPEMQAAIHALQQAQRPSL